MSMPSIDNSVAGFWQPRRRPWELVSGGPGSGLHVRVTASDGVVYAFYWLSYVLLRSPAAPLTFAPSWARFPTSTAASSRSTNLKRDTPRSTSPTKPSSDLFDFFDGYRWHLDERPLRDDHEINPDVLGYIFEKYINQKQMGAYYTKEDITGYITQEHHHPVPLRRRRGELRRRLRARRRVWTPPPGGPRPLHLRRRQARVVEAATLPLPRSRPACNDVSKRGGWNRPRRRRYALPTETWREHVARRERCEELARKLGDGEVTDDQRPRHPQPRHPAVRPGRHRELRGPELLGPSTRPSSDVTVLDPTCGSGAFLFAALNILQPLYEACLDRMEAFVEEHDAPASRPVRRSYADFRAHPGGRRRSHPNREYFVLKSIVLNNLYGVDIMEEAVEICKLRLFLKLVAQLERAERDRTPPRHRLQHPRRQHPRRLRQPARRKAECA